MKQMEYTVKIVVDGTIDTAEITKTISEAMKIVSVEVTNFRIVKQSKA